MRITKNVIIISLLILLLISLYLVLYNIYYMNNIVDVTTYITENNNTLSNVEIDDFTNNTTLEPIIESNNIKYTTESWLSVSNIISIIILCILISILVVYLGLTKFNLYSIINVISDKKILINGIIGVVILSIFSIFICINNINFIFNIDFKLIS